jgi:hypothetical protein
MKNCLCIRLILIHNSLHTKRSTLISLRHLQIIENFGHSCGLGAQHSLIKESNCARSLLLEGKDGLSCCGELILSSTLTGGLPKACKISR